MARKPLPVPLQKHLLDGCTIDMLLNCHQRGTCHFAMLYRVWCVWQLVKSYRWQEWQLLWLMQVSSWGQICWHCPHSTWLLVAGHRRVPSWQLSSSWWHKITGRLLHVLPQCTAPAPVQIPTFYLCFWWDNAFLSFCIDSEKFKSTYISQFG